MIKAANRIELHTTAVQLSADAAALHKPLEMRATRKDAAYLACF